MKGGTGRYLIRVLSVEKVVRNCQVTDRLWTGTRFTAASRPFVLMVAPLKRALVHPDDGSKVRLINRFDTVRRYPVTSMLARPPATVASKPPSNSACRSGFKGAMSVLQAVAVLTLIAGIPSKLLVQRLVNLSLYWGLFPVSPNAVR